MNTISIPEPVKIIAQHTTGNMVSCDSPHFIWANWILNDLSGSPIWEEVTACLIGYPLIEGKLGRDCTNPYTGQETEIKPSKYTQKMKERNNKHNGNAHFSDYTRKRLEKDKGDNLPIVQSFFSLDNQLQYIVEYPFECIADRLDQVLTRQEGKTKEGEIASVRAASWDAKHWIKHCKVHYLNEKEIHLNRKIYTKFLYIALCNMKEVQ